ncbi:MAG: fumarylacetoacetate hydrolase family protein [Pseudomonadota bacterium]
MLKLIAALGIMLLIPTAAWADWSEDCAQKIFKAEQAGEMVENPGALRPGLTVDEAYQVSRALSAKLVEKGGPIVGYKGALTGRAAQEKFGVDQPAHGIITKAMLLEPGAKIKPADFRRLFLEVEIALFLARDITQPLADVKEAQDAVEFVAPAVELPDIRFKDMKTVKGPDIIADNAGAAAVIIGPRIKLDAPESVDQVETKLYLEDKIVNQGKAVDALGGQYQALLWLANSVVSRGGKLEKGAFVITGATGQMIPGKPGRYKAEFGPLGTIEFTVE